MRIKCSWLNRCANVNCLFDSPCPYIKAIESLTEEEKKTLQNAAELFAFVIVIGALIKYGNLRIANIERAINEECKN